MFMAVVVVLVLFVDLAMLVVITLSSKPAFHRFLNGLLLATNLAFVAVVFGLLGVPVGFPGNVPVLLALLGGALVASLPILVWWLSRRSANVPRSSRR